MDASIDAFFKKQYSGSVRKAFKEVNISDCEKVLDVFCKFIPTASCFARVNWILELVWRKSSKSFS